MFQLFPVAGPSVSPPAIPADLIFKTSRMILALKGQWLKTWAQIFRFFTDLDPTNAAYWKAAFGSVRSCSKLGACWPLENTERTVILQNLLDWKIMNCTHSNIWTSLREMVPFNWFGSSWCSSQRRRAPHPDSSVAATSRTMASSISNPSSDLFERNPCWFRRFLMGNPVTKLTDPAKAVSPAAPDNKFSRESNWRTTRVSLDRRFSKAASLLCTLINTWIKTAINPHQVNREFDMVLLFWESEFRIEGDGMGTEVDQKLRVCAMSWNSVGTLYISSRPCPIFNPLLGAQNSFSCCGLVPDIQSRNLSFFNATLPDSPRNVSYDNNAPLRSNAP